MLASQPNSRHEKVARESITGGSAETDQRGQANTMTAAARPSITSTDAATMAKFEGDTGDEHAEREDENQYPRGFTFVLLTIGLMAVVLVVAIDNYIIGAFEICSCLRW